MFCAGARFIGHELYKKIKDYLEVYLQRCRAKIVSVKYIGCFSKDRLIWLNVHVNT